MIDAEDRIRKALDIATWGTVDGGHHKMWVIDQMVRALTGCPMEKHAGTDVRGEKYEYEAQGESEEYVSFLESQMDEDEDVIHWDSGIAP